jgi:penicillin-binding protein 2
VGNVAATAVRVWPGDLPKSWRLELAELRQLSRVVHVPVKKILADIKKRATDPLSPVTVEDAATRAQVDYLQERGAQFPGVKIADTYLRHYTYGDLAAQVLGFVGEISPQQLKRLQPKGYRITDKIGQAGVEAAYDGYLRGRDGVDQQLVDALGRPRGALVKTQLPALGETLRLTIDANLQRAAEQGIRNGIAAAHTSNCVGCWAANGGAIVALDPRDGSVLAMASYPTFKPGVYDGHATARELAPLINAKAARLANYPALNRAIAALYPSGSTMKPVTALAALQEHLISPFDELPCTGSFTVAGHTFNNWDPYASSMMSLPTALGASCDTFFYRLGYDFYKLPPERGHPFQAWAKRFGLGKLTGIDLGGEQAGLMPTPEWRKRTYTAKTDPCCWRVDRLWKPGDSVQLAIGQKDLLVTPLQMARFYALIANGGRLVRPHIADDVEQPGDKRSPGAVLKTFAPPPAPRVGVDPTYLSVVRDGLYEATHASYGTSTSIFGSFPVQVAGKTGTAEKSVVLPTFTGTMNQSWWCGYAPADAPTITVCAVIENGGHGSSAAAPATLPVFEQYFHVKALNASIGRGD